ncbi:fluoride efflux transporter CrcB [bacterium]|nr:fluoride efflux transporter CrcB [bacterium]
MQIDLFKICMIGAGGFLGASSRYIISEIVQSRFPTAEFPYGTYFVNMIGCLLIGFLLALFAVKNWGNEELRLFIFVGILGGFTTFSTFANDSFLLFKEGEVLLGLANAGGQILLGLLFVWLGYSLVKMIF